MRRPHANTQIQRSYSVRHIIMTTTIRDSTTVEDGRNVCKDSLSPNIPYKSVFPPSWFTLHCTGQSMGEGVLDSGHMQWSHSCLRVSFSLFSFLTPWHHYAPVLCLVRGELFSPALNIHYILTLHLNHYNHSLNKSYVEREVTVYTVWHRWRRLVSNINLIFQALSIFLV